MAKTMQLLNSIAWAVTAFTIPSLLAEGRPESALTDLGEQVGPWLLVGTVVLQVLTALAAGRARAAISGATGALAGATAGGVFFWAIRLDHLQFAISEQTAVGLPTAWLVIAAASALVAGRAKLAESGAWAYPKPSLDDWGGYDFDD